jgi:hypothetical protein
VFTSELANQLDKAIKWVDKETSSVERARLLVVPSRNINALWFENEGADCIVIAAMPAPHESHLSYHKLYTSEEFLEALSKTDRVEGILPRLARPTRWSDRIRSVKWGMLTLWLAAALALCAYWIDHIEPNKAPTTGAASVDLRGCWIAVELVLLAACVLAGSFAYGRVDGILIDDRNRTSLARFQWVVWAVALLGAYFTEAVWNMGHGYSVPVLQSDLLKLIGIVAASPVVSNLIVDQKKNGPTTSSSIPRTRVASSMLPESDPPPGASVQTGSIDRNLTFADASWADLYLGEEVANRGVVDVSRLQVLIVTIVLVITYLNLLWDGIGHVVASTTANATPSYGAIMPTVDSGFVWLLGISQGAYLAYKATPKTPSK